MTERATCWSITINNPVETEYQCVLPPGWRLEGQLERGEEGTLHYQGMLKTNQVRFSAVKKHFPRAHIEVARNQKALEQYVHKDSTRERKVESIPTLFEYQGIIAGKYVEEDCKAFIAKRMELTKCQEMYGESFVRYIDTLVAEDVKSGRRGGEFIAINPMWRASWKHFGPEIISRHNIQKDGQVFEEGESGDETQVLAEKADGGWQTVLW